MPHTILKAYSRTTLHLAILLPIERIIYRIMIVKEMFHISHLVLKV